MKIIILLFLKLMIVSTSTFAQNKIDTAPGSPEIIYHLFQRSFYDSNGDLHGDLNGIISKLDYLQDLGITSILLLPLYQSVYYHNYFADDFEKIDDEYGSMQDFLDLVKSIHQHGMKIYLDMETQYVTEDHIWWKDSYSNLQSPYSDYILYDDAAHTKPSTIVFDLNGLTGYNNTFKKITTVNLRSKEVLAYNVRLFKLFVDPNNDGRFDDGVDGLRLDHMMDTLDNKPQLADLFADFWTPLFARLKNINPDLKFTAEQANWFSYGFEYFTKGNVDRVFDFGLQFAITSFDKNKIAAMADSTLNRTPDNKAQVVFIENHDMRRFASAVNKNVDKEKIGAALNLLLGGIPSIYYGQELGMFGSGGFSKFNNTDGNDIPQREAFEWNTSDSGEGMALWYKSSGPWWDSTNLQPNDGISLEEQRNDSNSLYNFYKKMIALHKTNKAIAFGDYTTIENDNKSVLTFMRAFKNEKALVVINLSDALQVANISAGQDKLLTKAIDLIYRNNEADNKSDILSFELKPYAIEVWRIE